VAGTSAPSHASIDANRLRFFPRVSDGTWRSFPFAVAPTVADATFCTGRTRVECELGPRGAVRIAGPRALSPSFGRGWIGMCRVGPRGGPSVSWGLELGRSGHGASPQGKTDGQLSNSAEEQRT
jgi:hypothetical protein